jgi:tetratricopeptide (TPR) repeat protein
LCWQALEIDPFNHIVYSNRSASYLKKGDLEDALKDAEQCVTLDATWAKGYGRKGAALFALGRLDDALAAYKHGTAVFPKDVCDMWVNLCCTAAHGSGLHLEPLNAMLREGLSEVQAAIDARKTAEGAEQPENSTDAPSESPAEAASLDLDAEFASFMDEVLVCVHAPFQWNAVRLCAQQISAVAESVDVLAPKVVATKKYEWEPGTTKQQIGSVLLICFDTVLLPLSPFLFHAAPVCVAQTACFKITTSSSI